MSRCLLFGISGLIGSTTAPLLAKKFDAVVAPVRRTYGNNIANITTPIINFSNLEADHQELFNNMDCVVYCLGTTLRRAKSIQNFRQIEWSLSTSIMNLVKKHHIKRLVLLSASSANPNSLIPYVRIKGEIERFARELAIPELVIAKPSLLVGERTEARVLEGLSIKLASPILRPLQKIAPKIAPIQDVQVARALCEAATCELEAPHMTLNNEDLIALGGSLTKNVLEV